MSVIMTDRFETNSTSHESSLEINQQKLEDLSDEQLMAQLEETT